MEVGSGVKDFKAGDKVVSVLSHFVSNSLILKFCSTLCDLMLGDVCIIIVRNLQYDQSFLFLSIYKIYHRFVYLGSGPCRYQHKNILVSWTFHNALDSFSGLKENDTFSIANMW